MADDKRVDEIRERLEKLPVPFRGRDADTIKACRSDIEYLLSELASLRVQLDEAQKEKTRCHSAHVHEVSDALRRAEAAEAENVRLRDALSRLILALASSDLNELSQACEEAGAALEGK